MAELGWRDVWEAYGDSRNTFYATAVALEEKVGSRIDMIFANQATLSLVNACGVVKSRLAEGRSPIFSVTWT